MQNTTRALLLTVRQYAGAMGFFDDNVLACQDCLILADAMKKLLSPERRTEVSDFWRLAYEDCYPSASGYGKRVSDEHIYRTVKQWEMIMKGFGDGRTNEQTRAAIIKISRHLKKAYDGYFSSRCRISVVASNLPLRIRHLRPHWSVIENPSPTR